LLPVLGVNAAVNAVLLQPLPDPDGVFQLLVVPPAQPHTTRMLPLVTLAPYVTVVDVPVDPRAM
jgi:hypothetical protein